MINQRIYEKIKQVAQYGDTTTYAAIAPIAGLDMENPDDRNTLGAILDEINNNEHTNGRPMISAVVIRADRNIPGEGFFTCARNLGLYSGNNDLRFWLEELRRVHNFWAIQ